MAPALRAFSLHVAILPLLFLCTPATGHGLVCQEVQVEGTSHYFSGLTNVNGTVYFLVETPSGSNLWKTNGFSSGTALVKDIYPGGDSNISHLTNVNGTLFFVASDATHGRELWKSDGTTAGTVLVKDINLSGDSNPAFLTNVNGALFFVAYDETIGHEGTTTLWKSDGTTAGTVHVRGIGMWNFNPENLTNVNGTLFFSANDLNGMELWKSDGTHAGTVLVKNINPDNDSSDPSDLTAIGSMLFFVADDGSHGRELWLSNGTDAGTDLVQDIWSGPVDSNPTEMTQHKIILVLFSADHGDFGRELWISYAGFGASLVKDIRTSGLDPGSYPDYFTANGDAVYFAATCDDGTGRELWKSNGTPDGTVMVKDIRPGASSNPQYLTSIKGKIYFSANDGVHGTELWVSDGTAAGTEMVKDINPSGHSYPHELLNVNGTLFFIVNDPGGQDEIWKCEEEFPWELFLPAFIHRK